MYIKNCIVLNCLALQLKRVAGKKETLSTRKNAGLIVTINTSFTQINLINWSTVTVRKMLKSAQLNTMLVRCVFRQTKFAKKTQVFD